MTERRRLGDRTSGILLHLTSLPGPRGSGDLGQSAYRFASFLAETGQSWWQMLPVGPPGTGNSPYGSCSSFAGSPMLVSLDILRKERLLDSRELRRITALPVERVDFARALQQREYGLRLAFDRFERGVTRTGRAQFEDFCAQNRMWLDDFALYTALKRQHDGRAWTAWHADLRRRTRPALAAARRQLGSEVRFHQFVQYQFDRQWRAFRRHCHELGVGLIGDLPLFVAADSADVWAHPELFRVDRSGCPIVVAGTPPDYFCRDGQRWDNPVYRWDILKDRNYDFWRRRLKATLERFDVVRLDHFIGFQRYWAVPAAARTARRGRFAPGPSTHFFATMARLLGELPFIAEDLGVVTPDVKALRDRFALPGMRVLQFAFGDDAEAENYLPHSYARHCVVYTGTHDNDTTVGWFHDEASGSSTRSREQIRRERAFALRYLSSDGREIHWDMIRAALASVADTAIVPLQDVLGLGSESRMNRPGTASGNWAWRFAHTALTDGTAERLALLTATYGRTAGKARTADGTVRDR